jgi:hypothetical protein
MPCGFHLAKPCPTGAERALPEHKRQPLSSPERPATKRWFSRL